ncbi:DNA-methyltransferase [Actinomarinicola tropica]|uniref:Methyltransferase n=1 Tax=Actinomarinicola tropica TaxID=2789776 RepID=A0A5Q2RN03_9ACTN|nr:site-specific DNA-methyltransferase [Actinomarinicola tropica]QGG95961.1 hypothetical protein GH723_13110 [Actinomarinicola tropica]
MATRRTTSTSNFGVGARESHDATAFYERFRAPELTSDDTVLPPVPVAEPFVVGDARRMDTLADGSVALVVTSPPYFAGKQYEEELEREGVPATYLEYLQMLTDVFAECVRVLEPGGRIAVNVANLGRKPYRSLSADVIRILEHDLGLLLRGEIIWQKAEGAGGSCAWGSYRAATNPVLRDVTERIVVASKGRFDRARTAKKRADAGLPHESTILTEDFLALTLDVWNIPPESARRVGHPAPFPVELPEQLIRLYTYAGDLVLDPFMGSGSTLVAAARLDRRYVGYDLDPEYAEIARRRVAEEADGAARGATHAAADDDDEPGEVAPVGEAAAAGMAASRLAVEALRAAGFEVQAEGRKLPRTSTTGTILADDRRGRRWHVRVAGPHVAHRGGLLRNEVVWRTLGEAAAIRGRYPDVPVLVLTTAVPKRSSEGAVALRAAGPAAVFDVVDVRSADGLDRLAAYATGEQAAPLPGFWTDDDLG